MAQRLASAAEAGRLPLTFEIIYGHAFKPQPRVRLSSHSVVTLQDGNGGPAPLADAQRIMRVLADELK